ncbi:MAG: M1 family peptidase [Chloroflexi bacterium]|nr:M1 family peptidase [Chloroflexota bacterium]
MRKIFWLVMLIMLSVSVAYAQTPQVGAPGVGDSLYADFGNGGYDVQHYTLDLTVSPASNSFTGTATIKARATEALSRFDLDLIGLTVDAIRVNDEAATFTRDGQELQITPAQPLANQAAFTVEVQYHGAPENYTSVALPVETGWVEYNDGPNCPCSYVLSEPDGAATFFPVNDHPLDKATYTLKVTVPKPYMVAMNGVQQSISDNGDSTTTISEVTSPMASYLTTIDISQFDLVTEPGTHGVPIRNYFEKGIPQATRDLFKTQDEMIGYFESLFGPYPFDVYGALMLNTEPGGALEDQTLSIFGTDTVSPDNEESEVTIAHELAHQWYGDSVSVADWSDVWLNEGFATYAEGLWVEHTKGSDGLNSWINGIYDYVAGAHLPPPGRPPADDLFNAGVYYRGALTLAALRAQVGDETFFSILQQWYQTYKDSNGSTQNFIGLASKIAGTDLSAFFADWLDNAPLPPIPELGLGTSS